MKRAVLLLATLSLPAAAANTAAELFERAVIAGDLKTIETLLSVGINPDSPDRFGQTPLSVSIRSGQVGVIQVLLEGHADPNGRVSNRADTGGFPVTPLQIAAQSGNVRVASMLIAAGAEVNASGPAKRTALSFTGQLAMMQLLIEKGADVNARDAEGATPLDNAAWNGNLDGAAILLAHGARLNDVDTQTGATPLNEAAYRGHAKVVEYLLRFRPDLEIADKKGFTPMANAIRMGKEDCALLLLEAEPPGRQKPQFFEPLIESAVQRDEPLTAEALLQRGALANGMTASGATLLDYAASAGAIQAVRILLNHGADVNLSGRNGTTPLEDACLKGFDQIAGILLDHGAVINQVNPGSGTTALYAAASFGKAGAVKLLLARGAQAGLCGKSRNTPYQAALANGYNEIAREIRDHGGAVACAP